MAGLLAVMPLGVATVSAAAPEIQLTAAGNALEQKYAGQLQAAQAEIGRAVPGIDESMKVALAKACEATKAAKAGVNAAQQSLGKIAGAAGLVTSAVAWLWRDRSAVARLWRDTPAMKRSTSLIALSMERQGVWGEKLTGEKPKLGKQKADPPSPGSGAARTARFPSEQA